MKNSLEIQESQEEEQRFFQEKDEIIRYLRTEYIPRIEGLDASSKKEEDGLEFYLRQWEKESFISEQEDMKGWRWMRDFAQELLVSAEQLTQDFHECLRELEENKLLSKEVIHLKKQQFASLPYKKAETLYEKLRSLLHQQEAAEDGEGEEKKTERVEEEHTEYHSEKSTQPMCHAEKLHPRVALRDNPDRIPQGDTGQRVPKHDQREDDPFNRLPATIQPLYRAASQRGQDVLSALTCVMRNGFYAQRTKGAWRENIIQMGQNQTSKATVLKTLCEKRGNRTYLSQTGIVATDLSYEQSRRLIEELQKPLLQKMREVA